MKAILCVLLANWPIDRRRRSRREFRHKPLALIQTVAGRQLVLAASAEAAARGARAGMTLAQARALCPGLEHADDEPDRDERALEALARWMMRFSPVVSCTTGVPPVRLGKHGRDARGTGVFLDVGGCERLYDGLENLLRQVTAAMEKLRIGARLAIAPTPGAAWALAYAGQHGRIVSSAEELPGALAPLPPASLRVDPAIAAALRHLGIETISQLVKLPRNQLPSRFGAVLLQRLDQALGRLPEPLVPLEYRAPIRAAIEFDGVIDSIETMWQAFRNLLEQIITTLRRRGAGARRIDVEFVCANAPPIRKSIHLSRPSRDGVAIFNLFRCALETVQSKEGFLGLKLDVAQSESLSPEQILIAEEEEHAGREELAGLIDRLRIRLGDEAILRAEFVQAYVPEKACVVSGQWSVVSSDHRPLTTDHCLRPLHLLSRPREVRVICVAEEGPPVSVDAGRGMQQLAHAVGPERIAGQWWEGNDKTRDYFDVEDPAGRRWWIFRVVQTGRWYVHGGFE